MKTARPYRSHKYPACTRCHTRRSRCTIELPGQACVLCRVQGVPCSSASPKKDDRTRPKVGFVHRSLLADERSLESYSHIVGPVVARDTQILDQYLPQDGGQPNDVPAEPNLTRRESRKPIYYMPMAPQKPTQTECHCSRNLPQELLFQVDSFLDKLLSNYFEHIGPCYPLTDEEYIMTRIKDRGSLPQTFLIILISHALFYWDLSPALAAYPRPDQDRAWQTSVDLCIADMQETHIAMINTLCLGISGRPFQRMVNNAANVARTVALSHIIGLNHDCSEWKMSELEKKIRWRGWWGVVVQDRWYNFAQGTPPYISKGHYDVPIPTLELLTRGRADSSKHVRAAEVYIQLCKLTEIIGDVLPLIYHIRSGNDGIAAEQRSRSEDELKWWMESQPSWLNLTEFYTRPAVPGLVNLQLSYLSVRMLLRRIAWHEISQREGEPASSWLLGCQAAAEDIVRFVTSLQKQDLVEFWLPYNAQHFTSAVTLLLRCALQTSYASVRAQCMTSARVLVDHLRRYQEEEKWDLAEVCLPQSEAILKRIENSLPRLLTVTNSTISPTTAPKHVVDTHDSLDNGIVDGGLSEHLFSSLHEQGSSLEELFPEIFGDWNTDNFPAAQYDFRFDD